MYIHSRTSLKEKNQQLQLVYWGRSRGVSNEQTNKQGFQQYTLLLRVRHETCFP